MIRRLFNLLAALSLVLGMAIAALWIRSDSHGLAYCIARANWGVQVRVSGGQAAVQWMRVPRGKGSFCWNMDLDGQLDPMWDNDPDPAYPLFGIRVMAMMASDMNRNATIPPPLEWHGFAYRKSSSWVSDFHVLPITFMTNASSGYALMDYVGGCFPLWATVLLTAFFPTVWLACKLASRRRRRSGHCRNCGYDLRATPHCCPECGAVPAGSPK